MRTAIALFVLLAAAAGPDLFVDLSHPLSGETIYWPTGSPFELEVLDRGSNDEGRWYAANRFRTPEHLGTHLDAPFHFSERGWRSHEIPLARMTGAAVVVDVREAAAADRDLAVSAARLRAFEAAQGKLGRGSVVLIWTGWDARWPDRVAYLGSDERGSAAGLHFPGLAQDAARLLVERGVTAVGIDTASIDPGPSRRFEAHRALAASNVLVYENLRGLDRLPVRGAVFHAHGLPIVDGTGGPVRALALIPGR